MKKEKLSASFITGVIALVFLIIGYQTALFIHKAAVMNVTATRDHPDTVYIVAEDPRADRLPLEAVQGGARGYGGNGIEGDGSYGRGYGAGGYRYASGSRSGGKSGAGTSSSYGRAGNASRVESPHERPVQEARATFRERRTVENFVFDPNTVSVADLQRLGFSERQALAIDKYRQAGGRFRRKGDFAKSYVVDDSVFQRLAPYIRIPRIDLNRADTTILRTRPGIGKYFAAKIVEYRDRLGGYSYPEQLLDIYHFDREKYDALSDLITVPRSSCTPFPLWTAPESVLANHPYIGKYGAHGIILYRTNTPRDSLSLRGIQKAGILPPENAERLERCVIAEP